MSNAPEFPIYIDELLRQVGDRLFYENTMPRKARTVTGVERQHLPKKSNKPRAHYISRAIRNTLKKSPEVMVKVSGGGRSFKHVSSHLHYISRNGGVALEDQEGNIFSGRPEVKDLETLWRYGGFPMSNDSRAVKQAFNIVLSMPPGTDRKSVTAAARDFAKAEFGDSFSYVFATHDDEKHPHVHLCVKARGKDGIRLNPRKSDLARWRQLFAEKLIDHGIEANATRRPVRGVTKRPKKQPVLHMEKRGLRSFAKDAIKKAAEGFLREGTAISNPIISTKIKTTRQFVVTSWRVIGQALQAQGQEKLSAEVRAFVKALPSPDSLGEQLEMQLRLQVDKQRQKIKGAER